MAGGFPSEIYYKIISYLTRNYHFIEYCKVSREWFLLCLECILDSEGQPKTPINYKFLVSYQRNLYRYVIEINDFFLFKIILSRINPKIWGNFPMKLALKYHRLDMIKSILQYDKYDPTFGRNTIIRLACQYGYLDVIKIVSDIKCVSVLDANGEGFIKACEKGYYDIISYFLEEINGTNKRKYDIKNQIFRYGIWERSLKIALRKKHLGIVKLLIDTKYNNISPDIYVYSTREQYSSFMTNTINIKKVLLSVLNISCHMAYIDIINYILDNYHNIIGEINFRSYVTGISIKRKHNNVIKLLIDHNIKHYYNIKSYIKDVIAYSFVMGYKDIYSDIITNYITLIDLPKILITESNIKILSDFIPILFEDSYIKKCFLWDNVKRKKKLIKIRRTSRLDDCLEVKINILDYEPPFRYSFTKRYRPRRRA